MHEIGFLLLLMVCLFGIFYYSMQSAFERRVRKIPVEKNNRTKLGEILVDSRLVTREDIELALDIQKHKRSRLGMILVNLDRITPSQLLVALDVQNQIKEIERKKERSVYLDLFWGD